MEKIYIFFCINYILSIQDYAFEASMHILFKSANVFTGFRVLIHC